MSPNPEQYSEKQALDEASMMAEMVQRNEAPSLEVASQFEDYLKKAEELYESDSPIELRKPQHQWTDAVPEDRTVRNIENTEISRVFRSSAEVTDFLQRVFPDLKFVITYDESLRSDVINLPNGLPLYFEKTHSGIEIKPKLDGTPLPTIPDLVSYIENPFDTLAPLKTLQLQKERQYFDVTTISQKKFFTENVPTMDSGYQTTDEGSNYLGLMFGEILYEALPFKRAAGFLRNPERMFEEKPLQDLRVLDIGCGTNGFFIQFLEKLGARCVGIDPQVPKDAVGIVRHGDITQPQELPDEVQNGQFDLIVSTMTFVPEVLHPGAISNAFPMLKRGGKMIVVPGSRFGLPKKYKEEGTMIDLDENHPFLRPAGDDLVRKVFLRPEKVLSQRET